jgi:hypothetical protein
VVGPQGVDFADHSIHRLDELLSWNWASEMERRKVPA